ncbi:hypothetical protein MUK42_37739 [Musa troglodytarum]|uniref:Uncharacterized protein n=1 Tax=Musa troglodytarum TaxID=320322 RepID=A0A9E7KDG5_9LILI|nr:hypothetical protein MUK42_37739 [Musa troglodytarum]
MKNVPIESIDFRCCDRAARKQLPCPPILTPQNTSQAVGHGLLRGQHHIAFRYVCPDQPDEMTTLCIPKEEDVRAWNPIRSFKVGEKKRKELGKGKRGGCAGGDGGILYQKVEGIPYKWPTLEQPSHSEDHQGVGMRKWRKLQDSVDDCAPSGLTVDGDNNCPHAFHLKQRW